MRGTTTIPCGLTPARSMPQASPASPSHGTNNDDRHRSIERSQELPCHQRWQLPLLPLPVLFLQVATCVAVATERTRENARGIFSAVSSSLGLLGLIAKEFPDLPYTIGDVRTIRDGARIFQRDTKSRVPGFSGPWPQPSPGFPDLFVGVNDLVDQGDQLDEQVRVQPFLDR